MLCHQQINSSQQNWQTPCPKSYAGKRLTEVQPCCKKTKTGWEIVFLNSFFAVSAKYPENTPKRFWVQSRARVEEWFTVLCCVWYRWSWVWTPTNAFGACALKPRVDITRIPKQGYQCLHIKDLSPPIFFLRKGDFWALDLNSSILKWYSDSLNKFRKGKWMKD